MIKGIGTDMESTERFKDKAQGFYDRIFTKPEQEYCTQRANSHIHYCGKFCAKEAVVKATDRKYHVGQIEILNASSGKPQVYIDGTLMENIHISISHTLEFAIAMALWEDI